MLYTQDMRKSKIIGLTENEEEVVKAAEEPQGASEQSFKVYWSDLVLTDPKLINYYKIYLRELVDMNKLIGKFDNEGNYSISVDIRRELVRMYKEVSDMGDGYYFAKATYMQKEFTFSVEITMLEDGNAQADLYILETVVGAHEHTFKTFIAAFVDKLDSTFNLRVKRAFKIVDYTPVLHDDQIPNIAILLQGQIDNGVFLDELIELGSQKYVLRMLEELENCGDIGKDILDAFKEKMKEAEEDNDKANKKFTKTRRLLDETIEEKGGYQSLPIEKKKFDELLDDFNKPVEKVEKLRESYQTVGKGEKSIDPRANAMPPQRRSADSSQKGTSSNKPTAKTTKSATAKSSSSGSTTKPATKSSDSGPKNTLNEYNSVYEGKKDEVQTANGIDGNKVEEKPEDDVQASGNSRRRVNMDAVDFNENKEINVEGSNNNKSISVTEVENKEKRQSEEIIEEEKKEYEYNNRGRHIDIENLNLT